MKDVLKTVANASSLVSQLLTNEEHVLLSLEGLPYEVLHMRGRERVSTLFEFTVICADVGINTRPFDLLGKSFEMVLYDGFSIRRSIQGIVAEAERSVFDNGNAELIMSLRPNVYPLSVSRDSRVFNDMTVMQIVDKVLLKHPAPYRWSLSRSYRERVYTAQYREEDWAFISRLLEEEGIHYWFDHEDADSVLVFSDDSPNASKLIGGLPIEFKLETGLKAEREQVTELAAEAHASATKFTVGSFNPWNPSLKVMAEEGGGIHEHYDAPGGGPEDPSICAHIAKNRYECAQSHRYTVSGHSSSIRIEPGRLMTVVGHPILDNEYFITEVNYSVGQRRRFGSADPEDYVCQFEAVRASKPYRHPEETVVSKQAGFQSGRVVGPPGEEIHTDDRGRVRVQLHWDREGNWNDKAGKWMRAAQRGVSMSMLYPRTGWNVMTFMEEGNVNAPSVLSRVHDAEHPPTYPLPANMTRTVIRTLTSPGGGAANEFRFEDLAEAQEMFINASDKMNYDVNNDMGYNVGHDNDQQVSGAHDLEINATMQLDVKNDQTVQVSGDEVLDVAADRDKSVSGDETVEITGDRIVKVGSNLSCSVIKDRELIVDGDVTEEATEGLFKSSAKTAKVEVGGAVKHTVGGLFQEQVNKDSTKKVTTDKTEKCSEDYTVEVNDCFTETIGGDLMMQSGKHFMDGSDVTTNWHVKGDIVGATKKKMLVQATKQIVLKVGGTQIIITATDVTITSNSYELSDSDVLQVNAGSNINQN